LGIELRKKIRNITLMEFKLKHPYQLDTVNGVEIEDDIVRLSWLKDNQAFSKNTFVNINVKRFKKIVYRILKGASVERIEGSEVLVYRPLNFGTKWG